MLPSRHSHDHRHHLHLHLTTCYSLPSSCSVIPNHLQTLKLQHIEPKATKSHSSSINSIHPQPFQYSSFHAYDNRSNAALPSLWRERVPLQLRSRLMRRKIELKRSTLTASYVFSLWCSLMEQAASKMKQKCQAALIFSADLLLRAFYLRWCHLSTHYPS